MQTQIEQKLVEITQQMSILGAQRDVLQELLDTGKKRTSSRKGTKRQAASSASVAHLPTPTIGRLTSEEVLRVLGSCKGVVTHSKLLTSINAQRPRNKDKVTAVQLSSCLTRLYNGKKINKKPLKGVKGSGPGITMAYRVAA